MQFQKKLYICPALIQRGQLEVNKGIILSFTTPLADVAELVDALDSKSSFFGSVGSIPTVGTKAQ